MTDMTRDEAVKWLRDHVDDLRSAAQVLRESPWGAKLAATIAEVDKAADEGTLAITTLEAAREEQDKLAKDAAKYRWGINNARWIRGEQEAYVAIPVAPDADLSCIATRDAAINQARRKGGREKEVDGG